MRYTVKNAENELYRMGRIGGHRVSRGAALILFWYHGTIPSREPGRDRRRFLMLEVIFIVEESPEGGYTARALGASIFTEADDWAGLQVNVRDAVSCHFDEGQAPKVIRLHHGREEVLTL
jgi:hypothetical protein